MNNYKLEQRECEKRRRMGRTFEHAALKPGAKLRFSGSEDSYTVNATRSLVRNNPKLSKAERKQEKRNKIAFREKHSFTNGIFQRIKAQTISREGAVESLKGFILIQTDPDLIRYAEFVVDEIEATLRIEAEAKAQPETKEAA